MKFCEILCVRVADLADTVAVLAVDFLTVVALAADLAAGAEALAEAELAEAGKSVFGN